MSISQHGKQQKQKNNANNNSNSSKRTQGATAAVYPILQAKQQASSFEILNNMILIPYLQVTQNKASVPDVANSAIDAAAANNRLAAYVQRGQCVRGRAIV